MQILTDIISLWPEFENVFASSKTAKRNGFSLRKDFVEGLRLTQQLEKELPPHILQEVIAFANTLLPSCRMAVESRSRLNEQDSQQNEQNFEGNVDNANQQYLAGYAVMTRLRPILTSYVGETIEKATIALENIASRQEALERKVGFAEKNQSIQNVVAKLPSNCECFFISVANLIPAMIGTGGLIYVWRIIHNYTAIPTSQMEFAWRLCGKVGIVAVSISFVLMSMKMFLASCHRWARIAHQRRTLPILHDLMTTDGWKEYREETISKALAMMVDGNTGLSGVTKVDDINIASINPLNVAKKE